MLLTANNDVKDMDADNQIKIHQQDGLLPIEVLNCLNVVINGLKPRYLTA